MIIWISAIGKAKEIFTKIPLQVGRAHYTALLVILEAFAKEVVWKQNQRQSKPIVDTTRTQVPQTFR